MDGVEGEVGEEGLVLVRLDESRRLAAKPFVKVFAGWAVLDLGIAVGGEILFPAVGTTAPAAADVDVEAVVFREMTFRPEMPFPGEEGGVAVFPEGLCKGGGAVRQAA